MERDSGDGEACPQLELRLGPPGGGGGVGGREDLWALKNAACSSKNRHDNPPLVLSFGYFPTPNQYSPGYPSTISPSQHQRVPNSFKESQRSEMQLTDPKGETFSETTAPPTSSQKRTAPAPVVGWPPIRSFRKNISNTSTNQAKQPHPHTALESQNKRNLENEKPLTVKSSAKEKSLFVKINMDGVPIGRKVDLRTFDSYEKLSSAVDQLFRGLLAAQKDSSAGGIQSKEVEEKPITGLLDGREEYTLVYEDYEGDRMLVGDLPWQMFISTVKRLRVLKSSEVSDLTSKLPYKTVLIPCKTIL
ncbi:hypothetical protein SAY87_002427 [Trapa incisa]|uniref:Auxin-responsive protein n=1 Tax=Trapa incisa TaxID=236973 RepID=A0AAN7PV97_9MYRT|nr:hypothetical protein SAY87_002427 [Trapa incisa]